MFTARSRARVWASSCITEIRRGSSWETPVRDVYKRQLSFKTEGERMRAAPVGTKNKKRIALGFVIIALLLLVLDVYKRQRLYFAFSAKSRESKHAKCREAMRPCAEKSCKIRGFATRKSHEAYELVEHAKFRKAGGLAMHEAALSTRNFARQCGLAMHEAVPVSYTHLDVYKRQSRSRCAV